MRYRIKPGKNPLLVCGALFFGIGLIFTIATIVFIISNINIKNQVEHYGVQVDAEIIEISSRRKSDGDIAHDAYIQYAYGDRTYKQRLNWYSSSMYEGKIIQISIDRNNPGRILDSGGNWILVVVFGIFGTVFPVIGGLTLYKILRIAKHKKYILEHGRKISATYVDVVVGVGMPFNGIRPVVVRAKYSEGGQIYKFISENLYYNPEPFLPEFIDVWVLSNDYTQYYVDLGRV